MASRSHTFLTLVLCMLHVYIAVVDPVVGSSNININKFKCSKPCPLKSIYSIPLTFKARSKTECATECSKGSWCSRYVFLQNVSVVGSSPESLNKSCHLYMDYDSQCWASTPAMEARVCNKVANGAVSNSNTCPKSSLRVLEVNGIQTLPSVKNVYTYNLLMLGYNLGIRFLLGTSSYLTRATFYTLGTQGIVCASVLDLGKTSNEASNSSLVRSFCANGSQTVNVSSGMVKADKFYWNIQVPKVLNRRKVFETGGDISSLVSALNDSLEVNILIVNNSRVVHADIITQNKNKITAQVRLVEKGQLSIISHSIDGSTDVLTWTPRNATVSDPVSETLNTVWFSDSCWRLVYTYDPSSSGTSFTDLRNSIESGRRVRLRIVSEDLAILATPDYMEIDSPNGTITSFVLRVLVEKSFSVCSFIKNILASLNIGSADKPPWAHLMVTSKGNVTAFTCQVGSSECKISSFAASVSWFEEVHNWTFVHRSDLGNVSSLERLVNHVMNGEEVRVKVVVGENMTWFSCDMIQVELNGQEVRCQVRSHVSLNVTDSASKWPLGLGKIVSTLTNSQSPITVRSECFILSTLGTSVEPPSSCLWPSKEGAANITQFDRVEWFVSG